MGAWTVCLIVGILGILWFMGILKWKEGFVDQSEFNSADQNAFEAARFEDHYVDQTARFNRSDPGKGIFALDSIANGILDFRSKLTQAFRKSGLGTDSSPDLNMGESLVIINTDAETDRKFNFCKGMTFEEWTRDTSDTCGWLHLPTAQSIAVYGVKAGPDPRIQVNGQAITMDNGRKWFWRDVREARKAEEEKACRRVTACSAMDPTKNCAFNTRTGEMEWHDRSVAGPANPDLVTRPENCPVEYRWCADAQTDAARQPCLQELLLFEGASKDGWLYQNIKPVDKRDATFTKALQAIYERTQTPTDRVIGAELGGAFSTDLVALQGLRAKLQYLRRMADSSDPFLADLAQMLVYGQLLDGRVFVLENYFATAATAGAIVGNADQKAVAVDILQREWRKAGCQPAGSGYPKDLVAGKSLVDLRAEYTGLHEQMLNSESPLLQKEAIEKCLGVTATPEWAAAESGDFCNERGIEYFLYDGVGDKAILIGHMYSSSGLLMDNGTTVKAGEMKTILRSATVFPTVSYKVRTMISTSNRIEMSPYASWTNRATYRFTVNKTVVQPDRVVFEGGRRNIFEMDYSGSREASWGAPRYSYIDMNLDMFQLFQSASKPFVNFNFKEGLLDSNRLVRLDSVAGLTTVQQGSEKGIQKREGASRVKIVPPIRSSMIQIVSQRLWIPTDAFTAVLFRLENAAYSETCELRGTQIVYGVRNGFDPLREVVFDVGGVRDRWVNIAMAFTRKTQTLTVEAYVDQKIIGASKSIQIPNETFTRPLDVIVVNPEFPSKATLGWFHIYDRKDKRVEGFQNQDAGTASAILAQEASYDPQTASGFSGRRAAARIADFLIGSIKQPDLFYYTYAGASASAGTTATTTTTASGPSTGCPFNPLQFSGAVNANYTPGVYYKQKFKGNLTPKVSDATSAKQCEAEAQKKSDQAYTFNSKEGKCYVYADLGSELTTEEDVDSFSAILSKKDDLTYKDLKQRTLDAIAEYRALRSFFKSPSIDLYGKVFQTRTGYGFYDRTMDTAGGTSALTDFKGIPRIDEPRTEKEIDRDENAVKMDAFINSTDCLNGIYEKYRSK